MKQSIKVVFIFLTAIWSTYFLSWFIPVQQYGLVPRTALGLLGIITAPFLHGSLSHIIGNSISFTIFAVTLALLEGDKMLSKVMLMVLMSGSLTWMMGHDANHIGASGLIFSLWGYMLLSGWFSKQLKYVVVSMMLIFFYSGMIFSVLPGEAGISWEGHLFGFIAGIIVSWIYHSKRVEKNKITNKG